MAARGQATRDARAAAAASGENLAGVGALMADPTPAEPSLPGPTTFPGVPGQKAIDGPPDIICGNDAQCKRK